MNLAQYRLEVRGLLRDESYPESSIDSAINRVIRDINALGRFRFHEAQYSFNLTANDYQYEAPSTVLGEKVFVYAMGNAQYQKEIPRRREMWAHGESFLPTAVGSVPQEWYRYDNNWYIYPTPDAQMVANGNVTVLYDKDLAQLLSPMDENALPERHSNVVIYGAASQLRPNLLVASPKGDIAVAQLYREALMGMREQENWNMAYIPTLRVGRRFQQMSKWGYSGSVR